MEVAIQTSSLDKSNNQSCYQPSTDAMQGLVGLGIGWGWFGGEDEGGASAGRSNGDTRLPSSFWVIHLVGVMGHGGSVFAPDRTATWKEL